jgi:hypothetical protein
MSLNMSTQRSSRLSSPRLSITPRPILARRPPGFAPSFHNRQQPIGLSRLITVLAAQLSPRPFALVGNPSLDVQALKLKIP